MSQDNAWKGRAAMHCQTLGSDSGTARASRRRGVYIPEMALTLPILGIVLMALLEFSLLFFARGDIVEASRAGARRASLPGATLAEVEQEIRRVLNPQLSASMQVDADLEAASGEVVSVVVRVPMTRAAPDLLWPIGFSLTDRYLQSETRMIRE